MAPHAAPPRPARGGHSTIFPSDFELSPKTREALDQAMKRQRDSKTPVGVKVPRDEQRSARMYLDHYILGRDVEIVSGG